MRARLGLVTPAVGEAAVQRGALQDQQPSGGRWKSGRLPLGSQDRSHLEDGGSQHSILLEVRTEVIWKSVEVGTAAFWKSGQKSFGRRWKSGRQPFGGRWKSGRLCGHGIPRSSSPGHYCQ